ncbi:hypothetical protein DDE18_12550 [Nocardioides gansuensis]|uniref:Uncharacterized protein n=1 Tax=Nocardioides gansuensis TaxID=2138300 RepID=A0A2T8F9E2_9ACTN|nr:hypothetical protein [Nocardioides gansuensis]PVG82315.1 hypothetical protein DDE18_12550 [Nocardioides gansuensis]
MSTSGQRPSKGRRIAERPAPRWRVRPTPVQQRPVQAFVYEHEDVAREHDGREDHEPEHREPERREPERREQERREPETTGRAVPDPANPPAAAAETPAPRAAETSATPPVSTPAPRPASKPPARSRLGALAWLGCFLVAAGGLAALVAAAMGLPPRQLDDAGAVAVVTALAWALATRTGGRAVVAGGLALVLGAAAVLIDHEVLRTGAAVMTCVVGGVLAVMLTVPARTYLRAVREVLVATLVAGLTAMAAIGFSPTVVVTRFDYASLGLALLLVFSVVFRLGAGFHGLGRRGVVTVSVGAVLLVVTLAYAELLRRYGGSGVVGPVNGLVDWATETIGAFPRPIVALLGIPALVWGCHMRARRRQGWWVCAFGVAATVPMAAALLDPAGSFIGAALRALYSLVVGLPLGYLVIRADLALTGPRGARARRAEEAAAHRPEPSRFAAL